VLLIFLRSLFVFYRTKAKGPTMKVIKPHVSLNVTNVEVGPGGEAPGGGKRPCCVPNMSGEKARGEALGGGCCS
jgi:hypothetical protein